MNKPGHIIDNTNQFGESNILRLMIKYSIPSIVAMLVSSTYNLINMTFIGRAVGPLGIAAIAICQPITMIQGSINQLVCNGCAAAVAIKLGEGDKEASRGLLGSSVTFNVIVSAINVTIGITFMEPLLKAFGASAAILPYAKQYLTIILLGQLFGHLMPMNPMIRIEGYPGKAMLTMLLSTITNLICSPTFIFVFQMGIRGAALGTFCAHVVSSTWMMVFLMGKDRVVGLRWKYCRIHFRNMLYVMSLGLPNFLMQFTQSMLSFSINKNLGTYGGDIAISAWGVTNTINNLVAQPVMGLNQGVQPIVGYNIGAKKFGRVRQAMIGSLAIATVISLAGWALTRFFPSQIITFFNDDPELVAVGSRMLIVFRAMIFVVGFQQAGAAYFQFAGKPKMSVFLTLSRQVLTLLPLLWILPRFLGMSGILYAGPISDSLSTLLTAIFIFKEYRRLNKLISEQAADQDEVSAGGDYTAKKEMVSET
ncbi:MAG: MATE family efflux transporter [Peptococcaceae bacterium]|jgi:putative MATE family efflux protein|nr:MATE family efflux transporter [Peptococcaceae bacterium]